MYFFKSVLRSKMVEFQTRISIYFNELQCSHKQIVVTCKLLVVDLETELKLTIL